MAKPNYSFEKRQRELAKKKKKEEKAASKAAAKAAGHGDDEMNPNEAAAALAQDESGDADYAAPADEAPAPRG
ncbi:MAG: hypothetical protein H6932_14985 [Burkholderiaceae bacterium]|nr:hypothetical protein [Burkholderiaceae bacterium]